MKSDLKIALNIEGVESSYFVPIGVSISYGINQVPIALVQLDPTALKMLCDFDIVRRKNVEITIKTISGCLNFSGIVDGLSFAQSPGGLTSVLVVKHKFQWLAEIYPRMIGIHPSTANKLRYMPVLNIQYTGNNTHTIQLMDNMSRDIGSLDITQNVVKFYIALMKMAIKTQQPLISSQDSPSTFALTTLMDNAEIAKPEILKIVESLLDSIDTTATDKCVANAGQNNMIDLVSKNICGMQDNILVNLIAMFNELGCMLVIGQDKAFTVPEAGYLRIPKIAAKERGTVSEDPNIIFPAEYDSISFNDGGYVNIKGIYVVSDPASGPNPLNIPYSIDEGIYVDKTANANGNIQAITMPTYINWGQIPAAITGSAGLQSPIQSQQELMQNKLLPSTAESAFLSTADIINREHYDRVTMMNQWAEMEYCKAKYDDRTGSIHGYFNNNWAPGAVGTLYTRYPGTFINFFVTDVTHNFQLTPPNSGEATTSVSFKSGRMGAATDTGIDTLAFYQYDYDASQKFCKKFILNIG